MFWLHFRHKISMKPWKRFTTEAVGTAPLSICQSSFRQGFCRYLLILVAFSVAGSNGMKNLGSWINSMYILWFCFVLPLSLSLITVSPFMCRHGGTGLGLGIVRSLVQLMGGKIRIVEKSGPGSLFQFTLCFDCPLKYETVPFQLSPLFHGAEVILGIPDRDCRAGAVHWLENEGLTVHQVETWEHILLHLRAINSSSKHHKRDAVEVCAGTVKQCSSDSIEQLALGLEFSQNPPSPKRPSMYDFWKSWTNIGTRSLHDSPRQLMIIDTSLLPRVVTQDKLQDFLQESGFLTGAHKHCPDAHGLEKLDSNEWQTIRQRDLLVIWIVASNTPEPVKAALYSVCNSILVRKPLHAARLKELFQQIAQDEGDPIPITKLEKSPIVLSSNVIHYVRQQEWGDPYDCKTELPYAPSTNHVQQCYGQQHPSATATAPAPAENDSWQTPSEPKLASAVDSTPDLACISLEEEQSSQSSRTVCKTVTRNCRSRRKLSVSKGVDSLSRPLDKLDILVAEDNPLLRKLAVAMLMRLGATTHEASNGKEALEAVMIRVQGGERSFHCILMDCQVHLSLQPVEASNDLHGDPILAIVELQLSVCKCNEGLMCEA